MPKKLKKDLKKRAKKLGLTGKARDAYIYGTLRKTGWKPKRKTKTRKKDPGYTLE